MDTEVEKMLRRRMEAMSEKKDEPRKVRVFSTPTCPYCIMAKQYLKSKGIEFEDIDVSRNPAAVTEMVDKTGQMGVPVIEVNGRFIIGFDKAEIDDALGIV